MYKIETIRNDQTYEWTTTIKHTDGTLHAIVSDEKEQYSFTKALQSFVEQILYPSKGQRLFNWDEWPTEHDGVLYALLYSERSMSIKRAERTTNILNGYVRGVK
jgi:hypothetical protein